MQMTRTKRVVRGGARSAKIAYDDAHTTTKLDNLLTPIEIDSTEAPLSLSSSLQFGFHKVTDEFHWCHSHP